MNIIDANNCEGDIMKHDTWNKYETIVNVDVSKEKKT